MRQELADDGDVDGERELPFDLVDLGGHQQFACEVVFVELEVGRGLLSGGLEGVDDRFAFTRPLADGDFHAGLHEEGAAIDLFSVDEDVAVRDELLSAKDGAGKAEAVNNGVQAALKALHEELRGVAFLSDSLFEHLDYLLFHQHAITGFELLLLFELNAIVRLFTTTCPMLAGRVGLAQKRVAGAAENIGSEFAGDAVFWTSITCHSFS